MQDIDDSEFNNGTIFSRNFIPDFGHVLVVLISSSVFENQDDPEVITGFYVMMVVFLIEDDGLRTENAFASLRVEVAFFGFVS